jgi:polyvinyl alcohol dehydrogenase (cytochrome)
MALFAAASTSAAVSPADWPMGGHDLSGSRVNPTETVLSPTTVGALKTQWKFTTPGDVYGTPAVVAGRVYDADSTGMVYSLDAATGTPVWATNLGPATFGFFVTASPLVTDTMVIIGDQSGVVHALDRNTGLPLWATRPNSYGLAAIYGPPSIATVSTPLGPRTLVLVPVASNDETATQTPEQPCCMARGSLAALDPTTGAVVWQTYMISDAEAAAGSSGASVWTMPTYDPDLNRIYLATGNNFSPPTTPTGDAMVSLDAADGHIVWVNQRTPDDTWVFYYPPSEGHHDFDFGDSPELFRLRNGQKVVAAGQKSGFLHVLDAVSGAVVSSAQYLPGGGLGGFFADSAQSNGVIYANGSTWPDQIPLGGPPAKSGSVVAIQADRPGAQRELWRFTVPATPFLGGVAVANSVVYVHASGTGDLYALNARTGAVLAKVQVGAAVNGPSVVGGHVYLGVGDAGTSGSTTAGGAIISLGL